MRKIVLKRGKEASLERRHLWLFSGAIAKFVGGKPNDGEVVEVVSMEEKFLAVGHWQTGSIAVRILDFEPVDIDRQWWNRRVEEAFRTRQALGLADNKFTTCYRLIHGEGDNLSGLVVDIYDTTAVVQCHSTGMFLMRELIAGAIRAVYGDRITAIYDKSAATLPFAGEQQMNCYIYGGNTTGENIVFENGLRFAVDWETGQKSGFFIDQRENRELVRRYSAGRKVLNTFCYTGGFSVYALDGGAQEVVSVDSSAPAVAMAESNVGLNFCDANHRGVVMDTFDFLNRTDEHFDFIILDPPAFAKHHNVVGNALQAYKRLNAKALSMIEAGGILFTFSCSQAVSREQFRTTLFTAAAIARRRVRIIHQLTQPADHPINIYHPEGEYLKGFVLYVEGTE